MWHASSLKSIDIEELRAKRSEASRNFYEKTKMLKEIERRNKLLPIEAPSINNTEENINHHHQ